jgi:hypothetical protein
MLRKHPKTQQSSSKAAVKPTQNTASKNPFVHTGFDDKTFDEIPSKTTVKISGMGVIKINGPIRESAIIEISGAPHVLVTGKVEEFVTFKLDDAAILYFCHEPPISVRLDGLRCSAASSAQSSSTLWHNALVWKKNVLDTYNETLIQKSKNINNIVSGEMGYVKTPYQNIFIHSKDSIITVIKDFTRTLYRGDYAAIKCPSLPSFAQGNMRERERTIMENAIIFLDGFRISDSDPRVISTEQLRPTLKNEPPATTSVTSAAGTLFAAKKETQAEPTQSTKDAAIQCNLI